MISAHTEHHAVLNAIEHLEKREGFEVTWLNVSPDGIVDRDHLLESIATETALVSIMTANNETGVIQPLREISEICRAKGALLHSDMVQSFGKIDIDLSLVDAASFAAHKFYGPKGAGLLFLRSGLSIQPIMFGGAHENERRPGTENVASDRRNGGGGGVSCKKTATSNRIDNETARRSVALRSRQLFRKRPRTPRCSAASPAP